MSQFYETPLSKVSNAGPLPRYTGLLSHPKIEGGHFPFRSLTELFVGLWLISCPEVMNIAYEPESFEIPDGSGPARTHWPDFRCVLDGGELEWINAKYSKATTSASQREALESFDAFCSGSSRRHRVVYFDELARDGFLDTISLLFPYGSLTYSPAVLGRAEKRLAGLGACQATGKTDPLTTSKSHPLPPRRRMDGSEAVCGFRGDPGSRADAGTGGGRGDAAAERARLGIEADRA